MKKLIFLLIAYCIFFPGQPLSASGSGQASVKQEDVRAKYTDHMAKGNTFLSEKNYASAMLEYEKASDLMPYEDEPRLKMQSIEATLGINELAEVKRKMELAKKQEEEMAGRTQSGSENAQPSHEQNEAFDRFLQQRTDESRRDSLRKVIFDRYSAELQAAEKGSDMLARSAVYRKIGDAFREVNDDELALNYYNKALAIEEEYGKPEGASDVYEEIAGIYYNTGKFQNSIVSYQKSLELKQKSGDKQGASSVMSNIANVYETTYDYNMAIEYYKQSADLKENINDAPGLKDVMNDLGDVYYKQKVLTSSILSYEKTVDIIQDLNMTEALGPVYNKLGVAHYEMGNYSEAEKFFKVSMENLYASGNRKEASMALNNLGNLLYINNKYNEAVSYYERSLAAKKESGYSYGEAVTLFNMGNAYRRSGNQEEALKCYKRSLQISDSLGNITLSAKNLKALISSFEAAKNFEEASEAQERFDSLGISSVSIEIPVSENEMDLEIEKTQEILSVLNEEAMKRKDLAESESNNKMADNYIDNLTRQYRKQQTRSKMFLILASSLCAALLITLIYFRKKIKR
jgi:tetratricopeptide (TPR) repeat protein